MKTTWNITDIEVDVKYEYEPYDPGSRDEPPSGGYVNVYAVMLGDLDIIEYISDDTLQEMQEYLYEEHITPPEHDD